MSDRRKSKRFGFFSWFGADTTPEATGETTPTQKKEEQQINQVLDVETIRAAVSMRKLWGTYHDLGDKKQLEVLEDVVKLFTKCVHSTDSELFKNAFEDGRTFTLVLCNRLAKEIEKVLSNKNRTTMLNELIKLTFKRSAWYSVLVVLSQEIGGTFAETKLVHQLVQVLKCFLLCTESELKQTIEGDELQNFTEEIKPIQKDIGRVLSNAAQFRPVVSEMRKSDIIDTLIKLVTTTTYPSENYRFRRMAMDAVVSACSNADTALIEHLDKKKYVPFLVDTLKNVDVNDLDTASLIIPILVAIVRSSTTTNPTLLKSFTNSNGVSSVFEALLDFEKFFDTHFEMMSEIVKQSTELVFVGERNIDPSPEYSKFFMLGKSNGKKLKNIEAYQYLANTFLKAKSPTLQELVIDQLLYIFADHSHNYAIVIPLHNVAMFVRDLDYCTDHVQDRVLKLVEFIVAGLNYKPHEELLNLTELLQRKISPRLAYKVFCQIHKLIKFDARIKDNFREFNLLKIMVELLSERFVSLEDPISSELESQLRDESMELLVTMIHNSPDNVKSFRESGGVTMLQDMLFIDSYRDLALKIFHIIIVQDSAQKHINVTLLIEILQTAPRGSIDLKISIFNALRKMFDMSERSKDTFREAGFVATISVLINTPWPGVINLHTNETNSAYEGSEHIPSDSEMIQLIESLFRALTAALKNHPFNKMDLINLIGESGITDALICNGILSTRHSHLAFQFLLDVATERNLIASNNPQQIQIDDLLYLPTNARLFNPFVLKLMMTLLPYANDNYNLQKCVFDCIHALAISPNLQGFHHVVDLIFPYRDTFPIVWEIMERVATYRISTCEWRKLFSLLRNEIQPNVMKMIQKGAKFGSSTAYTEMEPGSKMTTFLNCTLNQGYTFGAWIYFSNQESCHSPKSPTSSTVDSFTLLSITSDDSKSHLSIHLTPNGSVELQTALKSKRIAFQKSQLPSDRWIHLVISHQKYRLQNSMANLYINGMLMDTIKVAFNTNFAGGRIPAQLAVCSEHCVFNYRMGNCIMYEDALPIESIHSMYVAGQDYNGYYQGDYLANLNPLSDHLPKNYIDLLQQDREQSIKIHSVSLQEEKMIFAFTAAHCTLDSISQKSITNGIQLTSLHDDNIRAQLHGRAFPCTPQSLGDAILNFDGLSVILNLIERSDTSDRLLESLTLLLHLLFSDRVTDEMERIGGYDIINGFLRRKATLFTESILEVLWQCVMLSSITGEEILANLKFCNRCMLDFEIWKRTSIPIQRKLFERITWLIKENCYGNWNASRLKHIGVVQHLLFALDESPNIEIVLSVIQAIDNLLRHKITDEDFQNISSFLIHSLELDQLHFQQQQQLSSSSSPVQLTPSHFRKTNQHSSLTLSSTTSSSTLNTTTNRPFKRMKQNYTKCSCRNLMMKLLYDLIIKNGGEYLDVFSRNVNLKWFYQFVHQRVQPISLILSIQLMSAAMISDRLRNDKIYNIFKQALIPYCNQQDLYYSLASLMLGRTVTYPHNIPHDSNGIPLFEMILPVAHRDAIVHDQYMMSSSSINTANANTSANNNENNRIELQVVFMDVLSIILELLKFNHDDEYSLLSYPNTSTFDYFSDIIKSEKAIQAKRRWQMVRQYVHSGQVKEMMNNNGTNSPPVFDLNKSMSLPNVFTSLSNLNVSSSSMSSSCYKSKKQSRALCDAVLMFLLRVYRGNSNFRSHCRKLETLEEFSNLLFVNVPNPSDEEFRIPSNTILSSTLNNKSSPIVPTTTIIIKKHFQFEHIQIDH
ncbi:hypothetical protein AKO1_011602 [Acrasis kona]|uniref:BEACH domain-containing protein n=1 Tax=Acrasis kona TaxID=1008807 RepID=A0AAW2Z5Q9_9EUKA